MIGSTELKTMQKKKHRGEHGGGSTLIVPRGEKDIIYDAAFSS
jgi:hypothetical protein